MNNGAARLTVTGFGFATGTTVAVGGQALTEVKVDSATSLSGKLPLGLCPGDYSAAVVGPTGQQANGGRVIVQGKRAATLSGGRVAGPPITLTGKAQRVTAPLPSVLIEDTTCTGGDWRLTFSVSAFSLGSPDLGVLAPRSITLKSPDAGWPMEAPLASEAGRGEAELVVPHPGQSAVTRLNPSVEIDVPSHPRAGDYTATVVVTFAEAPGAGEPPTKEVSRTKTRRIKKT